MGTPLPCMGLTWKVYNSFSFTALGPEVSQKATPSCKRRGKVLFLSGSPGARCKTERKSDVVDNLQALACGSLGVWSPLGEEKHMVQFQHFILEWAKHLLGWKLTGGGSLGTKLKRELQYLPQRMVMGLTRTQAGCRDRLGGRRQHGVHSPEPCPTTYFLGDSQGRILKISPKIPSHRLFNQTQD